MVFVRLEKKKAFELCQIRLSLYNTLQVLIVTLATRNVNGQADNLGLNPHKQGLDLGMKSLA